MSQVKIEPTRPYTVTEDNLKRGVFKDCADGHHNRCRREITHRFAQPDSGIWNYQCTCECHPTAFSDDSDQCAECGVVAPNHDSKCGSVSMDDERSFHIKVKPQGRKRAEFLTSSGGLNHLRVHAAIFRGRGRVDQVVSEIQAEHGDKYALEVVPA